MKLPYAQSGVVDSEKILEYLLNPTHPDNAGKARFFLGVGFTRQEWGIFADALRRHAQDSPVVRRIESRYGGKYILEGPIDAPSGDSPDVRTIWIIEQESQTPRLVTAYPYM